MLFDQLSDSGHVAGFDRLGSVLEERDLFLEADMIGRDGVRLGPGTWFSSPAPAMRSSPSSVGGGSGAASCDGGGAFTIAAIGRSREVSVA